MDTYRLRVELPAQAGAASGVAGTISGLGGTVVSVDLHEVDGAAAVDEMVVELPDSVTGTALRAALDDDSSAALLSSKRCTPDEPAIQARDWARASNHELVHRRTDLPALLSAACPLATVVVSSAADASSLPAVQMAFERGTPVAHRAHVLPRRVADSERRSPRWLLAVADSYPDAVDVALLTRPTSLPFTAAEVARIQLLMAS